MVNIKETVDLLRMTTPQVIEYLLKELGQYTADIVTDNDNYIFCSFGYKNPVMLVAHMDTCNDSSQGLFQYGYNYKKAQADPKKMITKANNIIRVESRGNDCLGADDRAGVSAILTLLRNCKKNKIPLPPVLFTNYEESGGIGVDRFIKEIEMDSSKINLMVEIDREGVSQYVTYHTVDREVDDYVQSFGFHEKTGCYSDIMDLTDYYMIPSVNVSAGYYNQHSSREYLVLDELDLTCTRLLKMLDNPLKTCYPVIDISWRGKYGNTPKYEGDFTTSGSYGDYGHDLGSEGYYGSIAEYKTAPGLPQEEEIEEFIQAETYSGLCVACGNPWQNCDCGYMIQIFSHNFSVDMLTTLLHSHKYIQVEENIHTDLKELLTWKMTLDYEEAEYAM